MNAIHAALTAFALIASLATPALAEIKVYVLNCTGESDDIRIKSYNGNDNQQYIAYKTKWVGDEDRVGMKCKGNGTGRCKIEVGSYWTMNVDKGDTLILDEVDDGMLYVTVSEERVTTCE